MTTIPWKKCVGKTVVYTDSTTGISRIEAKVIRLSPSGKLVKLKTQQATFWDDVCDIEVLEII